MHARTRSEAEKADERLEARTPRLKKGAKASFESARIARLAFAPQMCVLCLCLRSSHPPAIDQLGRNHPFETKPLCLLLRAAALSTNRAAFAYNTRALS